MRLAIHGVLGWLILAQACGSEQPVAHHSSDIKLISPQMDALDDSVRALVRAYEGGTVALAVASRELADLLEPIQGFATSRAVSPRADELLRATSLELQRRNAKKYGVPESLLTK
jgi:hypothetical protein